MAILTVQSITRTGLAATDNSAANAGDSFVNSGREFVNIKNTSGGSITVTLDIQATVDSQSVTDPTVAVGAGTEKLIGPFPVGFYNDGNARVNLTYSTEVGLTVAVLQFVGV